MSTGWISARSLPPLGKAGDRDCQPTAPAERGRAAIHPQAEECAFAFTFTEPPAATEEFSADTAMRLGEVEWGKTLSTPRKTRASAGVAVPARWQERRGEPGRSRSVVDDCKALGHVLPHQKPIAASESDDEQGIAVGNAFDRIC